MMKSTWSFEIKRVGKHSFRVTAYLAPSWKHQGWGKYRTKPRGITRHTTPTHSTDSGRVQYLLRRDTRITVGSRITIDIRDVPPITPERASEWVSRGHLEDSRRL